MNHYVRVTATPTIDNADSSSLYFDLVLDDQGAVVGEHLIFGYQCDPSDRHRVSRPFVIDASGNTDWGEGFSDDNQQFGKTDLRDKSIVEYTLIRFWGDGYSDTFRVSQLALLAT